MSIHLQCIRKQMFKDQRSYHIYLYLSSSNITVFSITNRGHHAIKIHNGGNYAHAQDSNAYNFC